MNSKEMTFMKTKRFFRICTTAVVAAIASASAIAGTLDNYGFLVKHMPEKDKGNVSEEYLRKNVALAELARREAPWRDTISDEIFREYVLPYSSIGEDVDDWRGLFREKFWPLVKDCKTTTEAVRIINSRIWGILKVRYSTKRDKADQSPFHSMRIGIASCTGLTILQIDAYRACGIPARFTGCNWTPIPGNHSWVEFYDNGSWHFFGDAEEGKFPPLDKSWFTIYAAQADASEPRTRIYATRWSPNPDGTRFWLTWRGGNRMSDVPADDVTSSYARFRDGIPEARLSFVARDGNRVRKSVSFRLVAGGSGKVMAEGATFGEEHDMNDHFIVTLPERTVVRVEIRQPDGSYRANGYVEFKKGQKLIELPVE